MFSATSPSQVMIGETLTRDRPASQGSEQRSSLAPIFFNMLDLSDPAAGGRIRALRRMRGWSQETLAVHATKVLQNSGDENLEQETINQTDVSRLERYPHEARMFVVIAACQALGSNVPEALLEQCLALVKPDDSV